MIAKPKRRWYQFSLKTVLASVTLVAGVLGAGLAFRGHQQFCWSRAVHYLEIMVDRRDWERVYWPNNPNLTAEHRDTVRLDDFHVRLANQWDHAQWYPWERLWIDETPPPKEAP